MSDNLIESTGDARREAAKASLDAFARDSTALVGIGAEGAAAASLAYWKAKQKCLDEEQTAKLMTSAIESAEAMRRVAFASEFEADFKRGVYWDLLAGTMPAACILLFLWFIATRMQTVINPPMIAFGVVALFALAVSVGWIVLHPTDSPKWALSVLRVLGLSNSEGLAGSVGALALSAFVLAGAGSVLHQITTNTETSRTALLSADLRKVDTALALTLAAESVNAEPKLVNAMVESATGIDWTIAPGKYSSGGLLASGKLNDGLALVRYAPESKKNSGLLLTELKISGRQTSVWRYVYGIVEGPTGEFPLTQRKVRVRVDETSDLAVFTLPNDTVPPPPGTAILLRENSPGVMDSYQYIDSVKQTLLAQKNVLGPSGAASEVASLLANEKK